MALPDMGACRAFLEGHDRFLVLGHRSPDGDCLGSVIGLSLALQRMGKIAHPLVPEGIPELYSFLPASEAGLCRSMPTFDGPWAAVILDTADRKRISVDLDELDGAEARLNLDHHAGNEGFGDLAHVDGEACSVGELLCWLLADWGEALDGTVADCLLTALLTDTQGLRFGAHRPRAYQALARLAEAGGRPDAIMQRSFRLRSMGQLQVHARVLSTAAEDWQPGVVEMELRREALEGTGCTASDTDGLIRVITEIPGVDLAVYYREVDEGETRISLRSVDAVAVDALAARLGGGGHPTAAGVRLSCDLSEARRRFRREALAFLPRADSREKRS